MKFLTSTRQGPNGYEGCWSCDHGDGEKDEAISWYKKALDNGVKKALINLGTIYEEKGDGIQSCLYYTEATFHNILDRSQFLHIW